MDDKKKWLARGGSLAVLLGFVFPSMVVSCSSLPSARQAYSLLDIAQEAQSLGLYLVPLAMIVVLVLSFLTAANASLELTYFWARVAATGISLLTLLFVTLYLNDQLSQYNFDLSPAFGMLFLAGGYLLLAVGLVMELQGLGARPAPYMPMMDFAAPSPGYAPPVYSPPPQAPPVFEPLESPAQTGGALLQVTHGQAQKSFYALWDNLSIGRSATNQIILNNSAISRQHALIRYVQGMWFIQDQNSTGGTYVNGERVQGCRLNPGDQVTIGDITFVFKLT